MGGGFAACLPFLSKNKDKIEKIVKIATEKADKKADKPADAKPAEAKPTVEAAAPGAADTKPATDAAAAPPAADAKPADPTAADAKPAAKPQGAAGTAAQATDMYNKHKKEIHSAVDMASKFLKKH